VLENTGKQGDVVLLVWQPDRLDRALQHEVRTLQTRLGFRDKHRFHSGDRLALAQKESHRERLGATAEL
jgi:hypothetical protein